MSIYTKWKAFLGVSLLGLFLSTGAMAMELTSAMFQNGKGIPEHYTCDGEDVSPPLHWTDIPPKTKSFVLIMEDPDAPAGIWDHWILFNIPTVVSQLEENQTILPPGTQVGMNSWHHSAYNGPCPPHEEHRYFFKLFALDKTLDLADGATKTQVETAMKDHILATATLMGIYDRK